jgi:tRNA(Ile)-lysidine synthase
MTIASGLLETLSNGRNLLAFSAGVDSSALFHILIDYGISFDMAFVNYGVRREADEEESHALYLARKHSIKLYIERAPSWESGFEANARRFRYDFFERVIEDHGYDNLLTAHQLNDRLEWLMMRLVRGAGAVELSGMRDMETRISRNGREYRLLRPILHLSRREISSYLERENIRYFTDMSNYDEKYERNSFRKRYCDPLMQSYEKGIGRSFAYLDEDRDILESLYRTLYRQKELVILSTTDDTIVPRACDRALKNFGYLMSASERRRVMREKSSVVGRRWAVERVGELIYISPYIKDITMPSDFREICRVLGIPPKVRPYIYRESIDPRRVPSPKGVFS